jgi:dihydrolipoamide dehydrogenase
MKTSTTRLLVIGGGPGGYVAAIRAAQLGVPTTLVEASDLGGTCLNIGCIPSKALIHAADLFETARRHASEGYLGIHVQAPRIELEKTVAWKDGVVSKLTGGVAALLKKNGVQVVKGWAQVLDGKTVEVRSDSETHRLSCEHLLLATGSTPVSIPSLPFGGPVISSTEALSLRTVPKQLIVVGAGYIGLELGIAFRKLGSEVTVVEAQDRILPAYDAELTKPVAKSLQKLGVQVLLGTSVQGIGEDAKYLVATDQAAKAIKIPMDVVLIAVGRVPRTQGMDLETLHLEMSGRAIKVDDQCRTSMRNVWAIGDLTGEPMLAHRAMAQGEMTAEIIAGKTRRFTPKAIPAVCFTDPEVVVVGLTPDDARAVGMEVKTAQFPLAANGRSLTIDSPEGFIRVVARSDSHAIVGWQAVGRGISELSSVFAHSIEMGERLEDAAGTIHAHPTMGEAIQEAAMKALGHAIHI